MSKENRAYYINSGRCPRCGGKNRLMDGRVLCVECAKKHDDSQIRRRAEWLAAGRCPRCGRERDDEHKMCARCREYMSDIRRRGAEKARQRRDELREMGMCTRCGKTWAEPGRSTCRRCADRHNADVRRWDPTGEKKRQRRQARIDAGLCIDCGRPVGDGRQRCQACRDARMDSARKYKINQRIKREAERARAAGGRPANI